MQLQFKTFKNWNQRQIIWKCLFFSFEYLLLFINKEKKSDYSIDQWTNGKQMKILVY